MIRKWKATDIDSIMEIWLKTNQDAHDFIPKQYWESHVEMVKGLIPVADVFVYEEDGKIKGFIGVVEKSYLAGLFVQIGSQLKGIGGQLLEYVMDRYPELSLDVYVKNRQAVSFYEKHGFHITQEKENDGTGELEYRMTWQYEK